MVVDLVISNGKIHTPFGFFNGSLAIDEGKIVSLAKGSQDIKADKVIDAGGNFVLPGMIDMHVHFRDPGFPEREDFETGTRAAAFGGVTTVVDMPNTNPPVTSLEALNKKVETVEKKAIVDFALIGGAGELDRETLLSMAEGGGSGI